jgi:hypothetical protein
LNSTSNTINIGADVTAIALGAVGAVISSSTAKSALAAASAGVVGAQGAINKDLYFQKTIPALMAQMQANREQTKAIILTNLKQPDAAYSLRRAYVDLAALNDAGSLPGAISTITQKADLAKAEAQAKVQRTVNLTYSTSSSSKQLEAWLTPDGVVSQNRVDKLQDWLNKHYPSLNTVPAALLDDLKGGDYEAARKAALADATLLGTPK